MLKINNLKIYFFDDFFKNVMQIARSTIVGQIITLFAYPFITRIYHVSDFGEFQYFQSIIIFFILIGGLRYEYAILLPKKNDNAIKIFQLTILLNLFIFTLLLIIAFVEYFFKLYIREKINIGNYFFFMPFVFLLAAVYQSFTFLTLRFKEYQIIGKTKIHQSIGQNVIQLSGGLLFKGPLGLFLGDLVGRSAGIFNLYKKNKANNINIFTKINKIRLLALACKYRDFPKYNVPGVILNTAGFALPAILIKQMYGVEFLGYFSLVDRVFAAPAVLISQAISQVFISEVSALIKYDSVKLKNNFLSLIKKIFILFLIPTLIIVFAGEPIFIFVFGKSWAMAGKFASILALMQLASFVISPLTGLLLLLEKQKLQMIWEMSRVIIMIGGFGGCYFLKANVLLCISMYGIIMTVFYLIYFFIAKFQLNKMIYENS